ncbi:uncharacterized protein A4U43_C10F9590 [Asparagus officinalis]|uniref:Uncharacterized protein n=1 Tax=Asparagus officinalis TaxID=4686 RepID=A0A5P1E1Q4_ASPOF|nr:uncharacterized protein A4U43_C10F9590 [Asparagus officinalis]
MKWRQGEESAQGMDEGSTHDSWASHSKNKKDEDDGSEPQLPPLLTSTVAAPPRLTSALGPSATPDSSPMPTLSLAP